MNKIVLMLLIVGCASNLVMVKQNELLPYKDSSKMTKFSSGEMNLSIEAVRDLRASKDLGFAYTGVKYSKTPIQLEKPIEVLLQDHFSNQLELRNIEVLSDSPTKLTISIVNFQVYELIEKFKPERAKCELQLEFAMIQNAKSWNGSYATEYISAGDATDGTERLAPAMASCLNNLIEKMVNDPQFIAFLK